MKERKKRQGLNWCYRNGGAVAFTEEWKGAMCSELPAEPSGCMHSHAGSRTAALCRSCSGLQALGAHCSVVLLGPCRAHSTAGSGSEPSPSCCCPSPPARVLGAAITSWVCSLRHLGFSICSLMLSTSMVVYSL